MQTSGNGYEFYEVSQIPKEEIKNSTSSNGLDFCECANAVQGNTPTVQPIPASNIEINKTNIINKTETNTSGLTLTKEAHIPEVKEVHISVPQRMPKKKEFKF